MIEILSALAEPNRLHIVEILHAGPRSVGELVTQLSLPQPYVSKHLKVLSKAGLVEVERDAQRHIYRLRPQPFQKLDDWLEPFRRIWEERFDRLDEYLQQLQANQNKQDDKEV